MRKRNAIFVNRRRGVKAAGVVREGYAGISKAWRSLRRGYITPKGASAFSLYLRIFVILSPVRAGESDKPSDDARVRALGTTSQGLGNWGKKGRPGDSARRQHPRAQIRSIRNRDKPHQRSICLSLCHPPPTCHPAADLFRALTVSLFLFFFFYRRETP